MNGTEIIDRLATELSDASHTRWKRDYLANATTWAQDWIVSLRPDVHSTHEDVTLDAGAQQSLTNVSSKAWRVVRGARNAGGRTIINVSKDELDRILPEDWMQMPSGPAYYLALDRIDHDRFWVWPPANSNDTIEIVVAKRPTQVTTSNENNNLDLADYLREVLVAYALGLALRRDTNTADHEYAAALQREAFNTLQRLLPMPGEVPPQQGEQ